jgi:ferredoxin
MYKVHLVHTDRTFEVRDGETILEAANRDGISLPANCRSGTCRTCMTRVLAGRVDHGSGFDDELALSVEEYAEGYRLLCSAFARSDVELDEAWS